MTESERYQIAQKYVSEQKKFWGHLVAFLAVNAGLIGLNLFTHPEKLWFPWVLMGWGAGLLLHAFQVFGGSFATNWEQKKIQAILKHDEEQKHSLPKSPVA